MVQEAETNALADKALRAFVETKNQGHAMIHDCEKSMSEHGATWFAAEMDEAKATILATRTAADGRSQDVLSKAMESLTAVAKRIEDAGLKAAAQSSQGGNSAAGKPSDAPDKDVVDAEFEDVSGNKG